MVSEAEMKDSMVPLLTVEQIRWCYKKMGNGCVILHDNPHIQERLKQQKVKNKLEEADYIAYIECQDAEKMKECLQKAKKGVFITSRELKWYEMYDIWKPLTDNFKIYHIIKIPENTILVAEVWK